MGQYKMKWAVFLLLHVNIQKQKAAAKKNKKQTNKQRKTTGFIPQTLSRRFTCVFFGRDIKLLVPGNLLKLAYTLEKTGG